MDCHMNAVNGCGYGVGDANFLRDLFEGIPGRKLTVNDINKRVLRIAAGTWGVRHETDLSYCFNTRYHRSDYQILKAIRPDGSLILTKHGSDYIVDAAGNGEVWLTVDEAFKALRQKYGNVYG